MKASSRPHGFASWWSADASSGEGQQMRPRTASRRRPQGDRDHWQSGIDSRQTRCPAIVWGILVHAKHEWDYLTDKNRSRLLGLGKLTGKLSQINNPTYLFCLIAISFVPTMIVGKLR